MTVIVPVLDPCSVMTLRSLGHGVNWFLAQFPWPLFFWCPSSGLQLMVSEQYFILQIWIHFPLQIFSFDATAVTWLQQVFLFGKFSTLRAPSGPKTTAASCSDHSSLPFFAKFLSLCNWFLFQVTILMELLNHPTSTPASWKNTLARRIHQICKDLRFFVLLMINSDCMAFHDYNSV